jgi:anti-anti-sigma factor
LTCVSRCQLTRTKSSAQPSILWLGGEHDIATREVLAATLAEAISLDEPGVVIDLSGVHFISVATVCVIVDAKKLLAQRGRSLVLRGAPPCVRHVFHLCGVSDLLRRDPSAGACDTVTEAGALRSWVEVPTTGRVDWYDAAVTVEPSVDGQVNGSSPVERTLFVRTP